MRLKAAYQVGELAEFSGLSRWQVVRLLRDAGVSSRIGRRRIVYLADIRKHLPSLWESLVDLARMQRA